MRIIKKARGDDGTIIVEYEIKNELFRYDNVIDKVISGTFDTRSLWNIFESDEVSSKSDIEKLKKQYTI